MNSMIVPGEFHTCMARSSPPPPQSQGQEAPWAPCPRTFHQWLWTCKQIVGPQWTTLWKWRQPYLLARVHKKVMSLLFTLRQVLPHPDRLRLVIPDHCSLHHQARFFSKLISSYTVPGRMLQCICVNQNIIEEAQRNCNPIPEKKGEFSKGKVLNEKRNHLLQLLILPVMTSSCSGRNTNSRKVT